MDLINEIDRYWSRVQSFDAEELVTDGGHPPASGGVATHPTPESTPRPRFGEAFLGSTWHLCELCGQVFETVEVLACHACFPPEDLLADGGARLERRRDAALASGRQLAGVGEQGLDESAQEDPDPDETDEHEQPEEELVIILEMPDNITDPRVDDGDVGDQDSVETGCPHSDDSLPCFECMVDGGD